MVFYLDNIGNNMKYFQNVDQRLEIPVIGKCEKCEIGIWTDLLNVTTF